MSPDQREEEPRVVEFLLPDRVLWLDTSSGSRYRIDPRAMTWERLSHDPRSNAVRSHGGLLLGLDGPPTVGEPAVIFGPGFDDPSALRYVNTTPVVRIWDREPDVAHAPVAGWWDRDDAAG